MPRDGGAWPLVVGRRCAVLRVDDRRARRADGFGDAVSGISTGEPKNTGTFPNLNITPQVATTQISPEEKQAQVEAMTAAQQQSGGRGSRSAKAADRSGPAAQARGHACRRCAEGDREREIAVGAPASGR